jgi:hypothetical protein
LLVNDWEIGKKRANMQLPKHDVFPAFMKQDTPGEGIQMAAYSLRYYLIDSADEIYRLPLARLERMLSIPNKEALPQWAGQRVRAVELIIQMENRKPIDIYRSLFYYLHFDSDGMLDRDQYMKDGVTVMNAGDPGFSPRIRDPKIINAEQRFAIRRRDHSVWWKPLPHLEEEIRKVGLGRRKCCSI